MRLKSFSLLIFDQFLQQQKWVVFSLENFVTKCLVYKWLNFSLYIRTVLCLFLRC